MKDYKDKQEDKEIDPLGQEISDACWSRRVAPARLLLHIAGEVEASIDEKTQGKARERIVAFLINNEYQFALEEHLDYLSQIDEVHLPAEQVGHAERMDHWEQKHSEHYGGNIQNAEVIEVSEVDKPVGPGGRTRLHEAVMSQDLWEIKRLVEEEEAGTEIKDNFKQTPYQRALNMGYDDIADYLEGHPH